MFERMMTIMPDMLVKLYRLPDLEQCLATMMQRDIVVRRAMSYERRHVLEWIHTNFSGQWAQECSIGFGVQPINCHIAVRNGEMCGFCAIDCTFLNFLGPVGVSAVSRGKGVGRALVLSGCYALYSKGYAYAVIGDVGEPEFFTKSVGAVIIHGSMPGAYPPKLH